MGGPTEDTARVQKSKSNQSNHNKQHGRALLHDEARLQTSVHDIITHNEVTD